MMKPLKKLKIKKIKRVDHSVKTKPKAKPKPKPKPKAKVKPKVRVRGVTTQRRVPKKPKGKITFKDVRISSTELDAIRPLDPINPVDFVPQVRVASEDNARGMIDLELTPYLKEPISTLQNYDIEAIFCIGPTQSGKTVVAQVCVAWSIDQDPGPMLYTYPDENTAVKALEKKITNMIQATPCLKKHVRGKRAITRRNINTDSMSIDIAWSNSAATMNVLPKKRVIGDEVRLFRLMLGHESNAIKLMQDRLTTYLDYGIGQGLFISSPSIEGDLLHQQLDVPGTLVLCWHVPCPACGKYQLLDFWDHVKKPEPEQGLPARCLCKYCGSEFTDDDRKVSWNNQGLYAPRGAEIDDAGNVQHESLEKPYRRVVFWWDSLVSPFRSFQRIWQEYVDTKNKIQDYRNFIQCWLAKFWRERKSDLSSDQLKTHKRSYLKGTVPKGVQFLVGGMDTQDDCLYLVVYGFGEKNSVWLIDEQKIPCEISTTDADDIELLVAQSVVYRTFYGEDGTKWRATMTAWDSGGHRTKDVYSVVRRMPRLIAVKGRNLNVRSISWSKKETHYNVRTMEYLEQTGDHSMKENFHLPANVSLEYLIQFANRVKSTIVHNRTGAPKTEWIVLGPDHLRVASAYAFSCLDVNVRSIGTLRNRLNDPQFICNPGGGTHKPRGPVGKSRKQEAVEVSDDPFERHTAAQQGRGRYDEYEY